MAKQTAHQGRAKTKHKWRTNVRSGLVLLRLLILACHGPMFVASNGRRSLMAAAAASALPLFAQQQRVTVDNNALCFFFLHYRIFASSFPVPHFSEQER